MPAELRTRLTKARAHDEAAYLTAIKAYTNAKKDEEAAAMEKDLTESRFERAVLAASRFPRRSRSRKGPSEFHRTLQ